MLAKVSVRVEKRLMPVKDEEFIPTRTSLLRRLKNWDDQQSWNEFFNTYSKMLYSVARRAGLNEAEAEDLVQETIIAVAKQMPNFHYDPQIGSFKSWLMLIIRRRIIDYFRKRQRDRQNVAAGDSPVRIAHNPADSATGTGTMERIPDPQGEQISRIYEEEWQHHIFQAALERVKQHVDYEEFQVFDCYAMKGWPPEQVAKTLNVTMSFVYNAKYRLTKLIKEEAERLAQQMI
jgi:RNA polymerase sigma-70 factor (ECF subfamily)